MTTAGGGDRSLLALLRLELRAEAATVFPADPVRALHGALHRAIGRGEPALAGRVHDAAVKPLTLSPLYRTVDGAAVGRAVAAGERVWARLGVLDGATLAAAEAALAAPEHPSRLWFDTRPFAVEAVVPLAPLGPDLAPAATYGQLHGAVDPVAGVALRFASPTAFRHKGYDLLEPAARLVFGSLLRRWRAFAPPGLPPPDDAALLAAVTLAEARTKAVRPVHLGGGRRQPGFVGWARYRIDGDEPTRRALAALAAYAAYAGIGARTAFGMGQATRID